MHLGRLASSLCLIPLSFAGLSLAGWSTGNLGLASLLSGGKAMAPLSSLSFALLGLGLALVPQAKTWLGRILLLGASVLGLGLALVALIDLASPGPFIQSILIPPSLAPGLAWPNDGRTSLLTAFCVAILALSLAFISWKGPEALPYATAGSTLGLGVALGGLAVLVGFLDGQPLLKGAVSLPSGFCLFSLGASACLGAGARAWPIRLFIGPTIEARLLRAVLPLTALISLGASAFLGLGPHLAAGLPILSVVFFALFLFFAALAVLGVSRSFAARIDGLISERTRAEAGLATALDAKERLLGELNHRTRNSLQLVLSLVDLEGMPRGGGASLRDRVGVLALVHDNLVRGDDPSALAAQGLVSGLAAYFDPKGGVEYETRAGNFHLLYDMAAPLAILAAEVDALMREGLPGGGGHVALGLWPQDDEGCTLTYNASWLPGEGISGELDFARTVARYQLDGAIAIDTGKEGTTISIKAGECAYDRRV